jgi:hemolysin III
MDFHNPVSSYSHLFAAFWMVFVGLYLLRLAARHSFGHRLSLVAFVASGVVLYSFSGLFHGLRHDTEEAKRIWQLLDQSAIFWLIVGSNVPIAVYLLSPTARNLQLGGMVLLAGVGTACLWILPKPPHLLLIGLYVGLGITSLIPVRRYFQLLGWRGLFWIVALTAFYVGGAAIEAIKWPTLIPNVIGPHELLHFGDVLGTVAHLTLVVKFVLPRAESLRFAPATG